MSDDICPLDGSKCEDLHERVGGLLLEAAHLRAALATAERERDEARSELKLVSDQLYNSEQAEIRANAALASAERVVEAAREPTECGDHAGNCCSEWCRACLQCVANGDLLRDALRAHDAQDSGGSGSEPVSASAEVAPPEPAGDYVTWEALAALCDRVEVPSTHGAGFTVRPLVPLAAAIRGSTERTGRGLRARQALEGGK